MKLNDAQLDRAVGALLGAGIGDALGAGYEFGMARLPKDGTPGMIGGGLGPFAPGEWTDDTSLTWCVADAAAAGLDLTKPEGLNRVAKNFRAWYDTRPPDIGVTTSRAMGGAGKNATAKSMATSAFKSNGITNGSLMRTAPVALAFLDDPAKLVQAAFLVSALTHSSIDAQEACALWSLAIRHAILHGEFEIRGQIEHLPVDSHMKWTARINDAEIYHPSVFNPNGTAVAALQAAWSSIYRTKSDGLFFESEHFNEALYTSIRVGHDTDTVASIAGALLGGRWGMSAIRSEWREILHGYPGKNAQDLEKMAVLIVDGGKSGKYGWPLTDKIDYSKLQFRKKGEMSQHPHDEGLWLGDATKLDSLPTDFDVVISLCRVGNKQIPFGVKHVNFRLYDQPDPKANPNLDFVLVDAAETIQRFRKEGKKVFLHCVASHSRTPTVAVVYSMLIGKSLDDALFDVADALPTSRPNSAFRKAILRLADDWYIESKTKKSRASTPHWDKTMQPISKGMSSYSFDYGLPVEEFDLDGIWQDSREQDFKDYYDWLARNS